MIPKPAFRLDSAHTRDMREEKVPLCDRHHSRMRTEESSFLPKAVFKCASQDCQRYYGRRYGYFDLLPHLPPSPEQIDPVNRQMKVCTKRQGPLLHGDHAAQKYRSRRQESLVLALF